MSKVFFTADTHFGHAGILKHCPDTRQYANVREMDRILVQNWNAVVGPRDTVYHLGDVAWAKDETFKLMKQLNGEKILLPGNHDKQSMQDNRFLELWDRILPSSYHEVYIDDILVVLCHYPIWEWNGIFAGSWHLHGHVHAKPMGIPGKILDVGVDNNGGYPFSVAQIKKAMAAKEQGTDRKRVSIL